MYVDESGFAANAYRTHGYAPIGQRLYGLKPGRRSARTSLLAAFCERRLLHSWLFQGTCNANLFNQWLSQALCPHLTEKHVVILDNAAFHKSKKTAALIRATGAQLLYLPPYSPDLNPIEHAFANIKRFRQQHSHLPLDEVIKVFDSS